MTLQTATEIIRTPADQLETRWKTEIVKAGLPLRTSQKKVAAYVNHGRIVADCPNCNSGIALHPDVVRAGCVDCGTIWGVVFPADLDEIADVLEPRPMVQRNWTLGETVADLQAENVAHEIGIG